MRALREMRNAAPDRQVGQRQGCSRASGWLQNYSPRTTASPQMRLQDIM